MLVKKLQGNGPLEPRNTRYVQGSGPVQGRWGPYHLVCLGLTTHSTITSVLCFLIA